uniref:Uncharacterized protein n=1 Tax=Oscillatoriales cyanobacterium SpSt-402 TaxID=2282168 RepID=A0A832H5F0_9CYAN
MTECLSQTALYGAIVQEESVNTIFKSRTVLIRLLVLLGIIGATISALPHPDTASRSSNTPQNSFKREVSLEFMLKTPNLNLF